MRERSRAILGLLLLGVALLGVENIALSEDCQVAKRAINAAAAIRKLSIKEQVPCRIQSREQVEQYLRSTIDRKIPKEKLLADEQTGKLIGLFPYDYNYLEGIVALYREQIGGFYEPAENFYAMAAWMPDAMQMQIAVHELTHALQDQHFNLESFIDDAAMSTDEQLARAALIEGDATAVMMDYSRSLIGQGPLAEESAVSSFMLQSIVGATFSPTLQSAPPAVQASVIFPYVSGLNFVHHLLKAGGYSAVDTAFRSPPRKTREILHPERTVHSTSPLKPDTTATDGDSLGEFMVTTLLATYISPKIASAAADGLNDDRIDVFSDHHAVWKLYFENAIEADEFIDALRTAYNKRFGSPKWEDRFCSAQLEHTDREITIRFTPRELVTK